MADMAILAQSQDINFVTKFETDLHNLLQILGKADVEVMAPGTALKTYATSGTLSAEAIAEKGLIPDSGIGMGDAVITELTFSKYRNLVGIESIAKKGYDVAVGGANTELLKLVQKKVRNAIVKGLAVSGATAATASGFQKKVAKAAEKVATVFEDEACTPVFFANPEDVYEYLGSHNVTLEQNFGLSYLENFMGIGNVIVDSNVPSGTVYGTATENIIVAAANVSGIEGMELTTDESGLIAVHNGARYENGSLETVVYCGIAVQPAIADRVIIVTEG